MAPRRSKAQFAEVVATAYVSQYVTKDRRVTNEPAIDFNHSTRQFSWGSSLNPPLGNETRVLTLEEGMFGDVPDKKAKSILVDYLTSDPNNFWGLIVEKIEKSGG